MIMNKIKERAINKSPLCVGIDIRESQIPREINSSNDKISDKLFDYAKVIIESSREYAACYKVQIACYEALGIEGMKAYSRIISYLRSIDEIVIADVKRGDIGSTADMYAKAHFSGDFEADIVTVNAYMGKDAVSPYFNYFSKGKGAFVLAKTSNQGSEDFQDLIAYGQPLYMNVLEKINEWSRQFKQSHDHSPLGAVIAVNKLKHINQIKKYSDSLYLLIPGYGAQGASLEDIKELINKNKNGVINISRGYTDGISDEADFKNILSKRAQIFAQSFYWTRCPSGNCR